LRVDFLSPAVGTRGRRPLVLPYSRTPCVRAGSERPTLEPWSMGRLQVPGLRCVVVGLAKDEGHSEEGLCAGTDSILPSLGKASRVAVREYFSVQSLSGKCSFPLSPTAALDELDWPQRVESAFSPPGCDRRQPAKADCERKNVALNIFRGARTALAALP
jgi:hypothetical protein